MWSKEIRVLYSNTDLPAITLNFTENENTLTTYACSFLTSSHFFDYALSQFYLYEIVTDYGLTLCNLTYPENNTFTDLYIRDFYLNNLP